MHQINIARAAILEELKRRAAAGDKSVKPLDERYSHKWHKPQANYYSGAGEMACPVCKTGVLRYRRAGYNGHVSAACSTGDCVHWME